MNNFILYGTRRAYYLTTRDNYNARIQDARKITDFSGFNSVPEILNYIAMYSRVPLSDISIYTD